MKGLLFLSSVFSLNEFLFSFRCIIKRSYQTLENEIGSTNSTRGEFVFLFHQWTISLYHNTKVWVSNKTVQAQKIVLFCFYFPLMFEGRDKFNCFPLFIFLCSIQFPLFFIRDTIIGKLQSLIERYGDHQKWSKCWRGNYSSVLPLI